MDFQVKSLFHPLYRRVVLHIDTKHKAARMYKHTKQQVRIETANVSLSLVFVLMSIIDFIMLEIT